MDIFWDNIIWVSVVDANMFTVCFLHDGHVRKCYDDVDLMFGNSSVQQLKLHGYTRCYKLYVI